MERRVYAKPTCKVVEVDMKESLLSASLGIDHEPEDGMEGRVREDEGYTDIWENDFSFWK